MKRYSIRLLAAFIVCVGLGILFGYLASIISDRSIDRFDTSIISVIQGLETPWLTKTMQFITMFGWGLPVIILSIGVIVHLIFILNYRRQAYLFFIVVAATPLLNIVLKSYFQRERPMIHRIMEANGYSFPSGHSMIAFSFYSILAYILWKNVHSRKGKRMLILSSGFMILAIGISRIYLGVHYPSDVLGGFLVSAIWVISALVVFRWLERQRKIKDLG